MRASTPRILIYSHDSFGLGHLRRCRAIAHSLVGEFSELSVLILSGSPIIGSFDFRTRVDFVRIPGVIKLRNGDYTSLSLHLDIEETLAIRSSIIEHTASVFRPDIFLVDKEPLGLRGEVRHTLEQLSRAGTRLVLGLRDVMDDPEALALEWARKGAASVVDSLYDDIWVYGLKSIHDPLIGAGVSEASRQKALFTGYLRRDLPAAALAAPFRSPFGSEPYLLVSPGGGGDGAELVDWVIRTYEAHVRPLFPAIIVLGPFMEQERQAQFVERAARVRDLHVISFTPQIESIMAQATAIVGMGGYNVFCEILSFDKPTLLVPRVVPRREQAIRASLAAEAGLVQVLPIDHYPDVGAMADALAALPVRAPPSHAGVPHLLDGLDVIGREVGRLIARPQQARLAAAGR
ncbi:glycosyltransferase [Pseudoxanthobacter sp.]|uniref:glycosyltransferase family protein n=1 Tax=Pseudoxanthobacter sp. TaxID=1925742 RepID=UPI002FE35526